MRRAEFAAALARYGADLAAWPPAAREAALALLGRSAAARDALARALAADAAASAPASATDRTLAERLLMRLRPSLPAVLPAPRGLAPWVRPPVFGWGAVAAAVALGLWLGAGLEPIGPAPVPDLFAAAQLTPLGTDQP